MAGMPYRSLKREGREIRSLIYYILSFSKLYHNSIHLTTITRPEASPQSILREGDGGWVFILLFYSPLPDSVWQACPTALLKERGERFVL
jgi:hypothetical protein